MLVAELGFHSASKKKEKEKSRSNNFVFGDNIYILKSFTPKINFGLLDELNV